VPRLALLAAIGLLLAGAAPAESERTVVYVVRHAEKATEPRRDPGLTPAGEERAEALASTLAGARLTGIVTSQFKRTRATAAPVARATGLEPLTIRYRPGEMEVHGEAVAATIRERYGGGIVLVVGHSDTVPAIVRALGGPVIERLCEPTEYASFFMLVVDGDAPASLTRSGYGRPNPPTPPECRIPGS
jgi:broad specificity phosphatase PhoE